ncbi:MAG TPA: UDP-N-acetylglucosamine 2-epimerase [Gaiellaceae bacterium]|nr:UDP-N-acetylglucosamine 2-epimerase [Gaiellaceae bacterium]
MSQPGRPLVLVHGDTMTTVLGAAAGRALRATVAHIEAGLRSFDWAHPFPEELHRRVASRLALIHYAPGAWAASNVRRGTVVDTGSNTIRDSLEMCPRSHEIRDAALEPPFGIVSLHRFELLNNRRLLAETLRVLAEHARRLPLLFVDHPVTAAAVRRFGLGSSFDDAGFVRLPRVAFFQFVALMKRSHFMVTDSGGSQEESFYLNLPCLVHRKRTERREGLGENVVLSRFDADVMRNFLENPERFRRRTSLPAASPSDVIVADLAARGFL